MRCFSYEYQLQLGKLNERLHFVKVDCQHFRTKSVIIKISLVFPFKFISSLFTFLYQ